MREGNNYTGYELTNITPFTLVRSIPHFEKQLSACMSSASGFVYSGVIAAARNPSEGYLFAMGGSAQVEIVAFDAGMHFIAQAPAGFVPEMLVDLNGDGRLDVIGTTYVVSHRRVIAVALATGAADFQSPVLYGASGDLDDISAVAVADLNDDNKPDIIAVSGSLVPHRISILFGNGDGTFQKEKAAIPINSRVDGLAAADLNGDGHQDLVFVLNDPTGKGAFAYVALGVGDGRFQTAVGYPVVSTGPVAIGDINGDRIPDIVASGSPYGSVMAVEASGTAGTSGRNHPDVRS